MPIYDKLSNDNNNITAFTEHINALLVETDDQLDLFKQKLFQKYNRKNAPKLVIFLGNSAYALLADDILKEWGGTLPMLLCVETNYMGPRDAYLTKYAIDPKDQDPIENELKKHTNLTVLYVPEHIEGTIRMMENFIPEMDELLFLSDQRYISKQNRHDIQNIVKEKYPDLKLKLITAGEVDFNSLVSLLNKAGKHTGVLFFSWFEKDLRGGNAFVLSTETYRTLGVCSPLPIFALNDIELSNNGMLGGYGYTREHIAQKTVETMTQLLTGNFLNKIVMPSDPCPIINYPVLLKKNLPLSMCPANTFFYMKPPSFWVQYKYHISIGGTVLFFLVLLLLSTDYKLI